MTAFASEILKQVEAAFEDGALTTLVLRSEDRELDPTYQAVKVVHAPSGMEVECDQFQSLIENKAMALAKLIGKRVGSKL